MMGRMGRSPRGPITQFYRIKKLNSKMIVGGVSVWETQIKSQEIHIGGGNGGRVNCTDEKKTIIIRWVWLHNTTFH